MTKKEYRKQYYLTHKKESSEYAKKYFIEHKEEIIRKHKSKKCINCGVKINYNSKRCSTCAGKLHSNKMKGISKKDGCSLKKYYCIICNFPIGWQAYVYGTKKCKKCSHIKHDKNFYNKYCIDCNKKLNNNAIYLGTLRCYSCSMKNKIKQGIYINNFGINHYNYKDGRGYEPYPLEFNNKLKEQIRDRDNHTCQDCGMTEEEHLKKYNRILEIHHKDHNKNNCNKSNLITMCKICNIRDNKKD